MKKEKLLSDFLTSLQNKNHINDKKLEFVLGGTNGTCGEIVSTDTKSGEKQKSDDCDYDHDDCEPISLPDLGGPVV